MNSNAVQVFKEERMNMFPDSNTTERLWSVLTWKVEQQNPSSKELLKNILCDKWQNISPQICDRLVSMPGRMKSAQIKEGYTQYIFMKKTKKQWNHTSKGCRYFDFWWISTKCVCTFSPNTISNAFSDLLTFLWVISLIFVFALCTN